jgi:hypothetical protein
VLISDLYEGGDNDLAALGVPTFACTPNQFPGLIATAIQRDDLTVWAGNNDIQLAAPEE